MVQRGPEQKPVRLSAINTVFSCERVFDAAKSQKQPPQVFCKRRPAALLERGFSIAKFLRKPILKNICERLVLKINISVTNSEAVVQRFSVKSCSQKFRKIHWKAPVPEYLFNKVAGLRLWYRCFPVNVVKFRKNPHSMNTSGGCFCKFTERW